MCFGQFLCESSQQAMCAHVWQGQRGKAQIPRKIVLKGACARILVRVCVRKVVKNNLARQHAVFTAMPVDFTHSFGRYDYGFIYMDIKICKA